MNWKKVISIVLIGVLGLMCMTACQATAGTSEENHVSDTSTAAQENADNQVTEDETSGRTIVVYLQLIILIYGVFSGKLGVKKWLILLNPVCGLIVGIVLGAVLPGSLSGIPMGMRNLGEGLMYLIPYAYWQNHRA